MGTEDLKEMSELRAMQRERERERRRLRDRQRRQSMSVEERENHLAKRRRNYQLRRQRVGNAQSDSQPQQTSVSSIGKIEHDVEIPVLDPIVQHDDVVEQRNEKSNLTGPRSEGSEGTTHKLADLSRRRLHQIRHLARSSINQVDGLNVGNGRTGLDMVMKENGNTNCLQLVCSGSDQLPKRLRLTYVKRLAREANSSKKQAVNQNHQSKPEGKTKLTKQVRKKTLNFRESPGQELIIAFQQHK